MVAASDPEFSVEYAREILHYNPETGIFTWKKSMGSVRAGSLAGFVRADYISIAIDGRNVYAHRLAWFITYGRWPNPVIDHINRNKRDNRLVNLREATLWENRQNIAPIKVARYYSATTQLLLERNMNTTIDRLRHKISPLEDKEFTKELLPRMQEADFSAYERVYKGEPRVVISPSDAWNLLFPDKEGNLHELTVLGRSLQALLWERSYLRGDLVFTKTLLEIETDGY